MILAILNISGLVVTWGVWLWLLGLPFSPVRSLVVAVGGILAVLAVVIAGRRLLDHSPTVDRARWVTVLIHYLFAICFGSAILEAARFAMYSQAWPIPVAGWLGLALMILSGLVLAIGAFNLIVQGLGSPFAANLTRLVVTDWIYAWTRNPIVVSALAFLVGFGLWIQSALFIIWVLMVVSPAIFVFISIYEERELEIRFGQTYLDYKAKTPRFIPRRPEKPA